MKELEDRYFKEIGKYKLRLCWGTVRVVERKFGPGGSTAIALDFWGKCILFFLLFVVFKVH